MNYSSNSTTLQGIILARQIQSVEFTLTRTFMKLFRTGSSSTVNECQVNFGFSLLRVR